jgi:hypothetical protein
MVSIVAGQRFGRLIAVERSARSGHWRFRCDCGNEKEISVYKAKNGNTRSCGCLRNEKWWATHAEQIKNTRRKLKQ